MRDVRCPACERLLFRVSEDDDLPEIEVKCTKCRRLVSVQGRTATIKDFARR